MKVKFERIVDRWSEMSTTDLGSQINPIVSQAIQFFTEIGYGSDTHQLELDSFPDIENYLRAFAINEMPNEPDEITFADSLDLHHVTITDYAAEEFDFWLMMNRRFIDHYHYCKGIA